MPSSCAACFIVVVELMPAGNRIQRQYVTRDHEAPGLKFVVLGSDKLDWFEGIKSFGAQVSGMDTCKVTSI